MDERNIVNENTLDKEEIRKNATFLTPTAAIVLFLQLQVLMLYAFLGY